MTQGYGAALGLVSPAAAAAPAAGVIDAPVRPSVGARDRVFRGALLCADTAAAAGALLVVTLVSGLALAPGALLAPLLVAGLSRLHGLNDRDDLVLRKTTLDEVPALFQLAALTTLIVWLLDGVVVQGTLSAGGATAFWAALMAGLVVTRSTARSAAAAVTQAERCLLIGDPVAMEAVAVKLEDAPGVDAQVVMRLTIDDAAQHASMLEDLEFLVRTADVHRVILAPRDADAESILDAIRLAKELGVKVSLLPRVFEVVGSSVVFDDLNGLKVLGVRRFGLSRSSLLIKRAVDLAGATAGLLVLAPSIALVALAIRADSRGPVFFRQVRVGRDGRRFQMVKFRTMIEGADTLKFGLRERNEADGLFKIAADPRVTRVGRLLRRTSLDELPQLANVLLGDMSLVGPRPLVVDEDERIEGWHRRRLHLVPGMTGHWQILGSSRVPLHEMVKIDYLYVASWSLWGDVKIMLRTVLFMARRGGV